jgi:hypothetical protein
MRQVREAPVRMLFAVQPEKVQVLQQMRELPLPLLPQVQTISEFMYMLPEVPLTPLHLL